jgi:exopolyphosphatase / guanosine-5'-triphosphate,3'-diphosphate pyrophosphatase
LRYAAIDIGSNAVRLLIADIINNDKKVSFKKNTLIRVPLRLGDDAFLDKRISEKKSEELVKTMIAFRHLMDVYKVEDYMACATSAMREAKNGSELVKQIKKSANINLEIVEGQREANIIYSSHIEQHLERKKNYLYIDVGGGSTELSVFCNGEMISSRSFNIGAIRILDNQDQEETWTEMKEWVKERSRIYKNLSGIGTGGNINKLFRMADEKEGSPLTFTKLRALNGYLNSFSLKDRITVLGLNQDRADVIIPASEIYLTVMKWAGVKQIFVPRVGLVDGIIQLLIEKNAV